ncbi:MAG: GNAT family N-acetyltransferase [Streptosporangiales bacterium]|nr:GNAT family N-acetyltransferase [Streptosporangiales bacterium]
MNPPRSQLPGRRSIMELHTGYPAFRALIATRGDHLVGFGYGFTGRLGQWWHDVVQSALRVEYGERLADGWLAAPFEVGELHVHPDHQGAGLGRSLITGLCAEREERSVLLSTQDAETRARRLYRSLGFTDLLTGYRFPGGGEPYAVMGAELPLNPHPARPPT